jgi:carboxymethylenebutenolidase
LIGAATALGNTVQGGQKSEQGGQAARPSPKLRGEMTAYQSGELKIPAYITRPKKRGAVPGAVLVIHEVFGLNDHIKSVADRIAEAGYLALAPNFFVRAPEPPPKDTTDMTALRRAASSIPPETAIRDMQAALDFMKTMKGVTPHFASIGFCMGGGFSYQLATHTKDLAGAVIFYGRTPLELAPQVSCPLLGSFGALDNGIPPEKVREFEEALKRAGKEADIKVYAGAGHGFFNDTRPEAYNAEAAADAWQRTLKFFRARMRA